jgi:hypothetical protein
MRLKKYNEFFDSELEFKSLLGQEESKFLELKTKWLESVGIHSNPSIIYDNKYYKEIINMGKKVVPILINDLKSSDGDWYEALNKITGVNPIKKENNGFVDKMQNDWINWYKENV